MNTLTATPVPAMAAPLRTILPARPMRPTRFDIWDLLVTAMDEVTATGSRAAWQGAHGAAEQWRFATGAADLDIWCDDDAYAQLDAVLRSLDAARVQHASDPRRLQHSSYAIETHDGLAVVDLTRGDLRVGPVLMVPTTEVHTSPGEPVGHRLVGTAEAADLFIRPLLRGRIVDGARLEQARTAWTAADEAERSALTTRLRRQLGRKVSHGIVTSLEGATPSPDLARAARIALARVSLRPSNVTATWKQRRTVLPARGRAGSLGLSTKGALVVLVGTDGSGKSTVAAELDQRLTSLGLDTSSVYMGMARGNLPGVALARRLLGVAPAGDHAPKPTASTSSTAPSNGDRQHATVRRAAAWFYAAEYLYRWWRDIRPGMRHGGVVIADRYVYDLRESPWPGSRASRVAEWLMPKPDVLVLPDAPDALIHARKPERPAVEQAEQQGRFRALVADDPAGTASLTIDTSGMCPSTADPVAPAVSAVVAALHRNH
jgi:thymidylate kinase